MFYVYIIFSESIQQFYCGQTNNILFRIQQHNLADILDNKAPESQKDLSLLIAYADDKQKRCNLKNEMNQKPRDNLVPVIPPSPAKLPSMIHRNAIRSPSLNCHPRPAWKAINTD